VVVTWHRRNDIPLGVLEAGFSTSPSLCIDAMSNLQLVGPWAVAVVNCLDTAPRNHMSVKQDETRVASPHHAQLAELSCCGHMDLPRDHTQP